MDLKVKIITEADATAVRAYAKEVKGIAAETAPASTEVKKLTPALDEAGKAAERTQVSKKNLKDTIKSLSHAFPELGSVAVALKHPLVILAAVIAGAVVAVKNFINQVNEMEKAIQAFDSLNKAAVPFKKIADDNARSANAQADAMARIATTSDDAETALGKAISKLDEKARRDAAERAAQREMEEAAINADEQTGAISGPEAINRRSALTTRFGALDREAAARLGVNKVEATEQARRAAVEAEGAARLALPGARDALSQAEIDAAARKENRKSDRAKLAMDEEDARKKIKEVQNTEEFFNPNTVTGNLNAAFILRSPAALQREANERELKERMRIEDIKTKRADLNAEDDNDDANVTAARARVKDLDTNQQSASKQAKNLLNRRGDIARTVDADTESAASVAALEAKTRQVNDNAALHKAFIAEQERKQKAEEAFLQTILKNEAKGTDRWIEAEAKLKRASEGR